MSMNSRYRERKYNTSDNDRLLRALSQPVQAWEKKWTQHSNSKTLQTYKWIKSDKVIEFEQDEESEEEPEPMEIEQAEQAAAPVEATTTTATTTTTTDQNNESVTTTVVETTTTTKEPSKEPTTTKTTEASTTSASGVVESSTTTTTSFDHADKVTSSSKNEIPGGPSSLISNKALSSVQKEEDMDEDEQRSQTPKLDDISDEEPDPTLDNDDDDNDVDSINDPSKHPALAPHAQARMTDDEATTMTDSTAATPQTEGNTPMPLLEEDDDMEEVSQQHQHQQPQVAHPLSQEIYSSIMASGEDVNSLNNDSPAIRTPEDIVNVSDPQQQPQRQQDGQDQQHQPQE